MVEADSHVIVASTPHFEGTPALPNLTFLKVTLLSYKYKNRISI